MSLVLQQYLHSDIGNHVPGDLYEQLSHNQGRSLSHWEQWKLILVCITRGSSIFNITLTAAFHNDLTTCYYELWPKDSETFFLIAGMESKPLGISHSFSAKSQTSISTSEKLYNFLGYRHLALCKSSANY